MSGWVDEFIGFIEFIEFNQVAAGFSLRKIIVDSSKEGVKESTHLHIHTLTYGGNYDTTKLQKLFR